MTKKSLAISGVLSVAMLSAGSASALAGDAARAKRDLTFAKSNAESERWDDFEAAMKKVAADMEGLSAAEKASLAAPLAEVRALVTKSVEEDVTKRLDRAAKADPGAGKLDVDRARMRLDDDVAKAYADPAVIAKLRARLPGTAGVPTPTPPTPTPPTPAGGGAGAGGKPLTGDLATAAARLRTAHLMLDQGDANIAQGAIAQALKLLAPLPEADKAPLMADIASLNKQVDDFYVKGQKAEDHRRVDEQVNRYVGTAEDSVKPGVVCDYDWVEKSEQLLATHDVKTNLTPDEIAKYKARLDAERVKLAAHNSATSVERATPILKELEDTIAGDPFKGTDDRGAYSAFGSLNTLANRVRTEFDRVPRDDPKVKAVLDRVTADMAKVEAASAKWALEQTRTDLAASWKAHNADFAGWEAEQVNAESAKRRRVQGLDKTTQAVRGSGYWLANSSTKEALAKYPNDAGVKATVAAARASLDGAAAKLDAAFNAVVAEAERAPMPTRESDRAELGELARSADNWFAGTKFHDADVARAKGLEDKWKADVARMEKEAAELLKKLTAEATARWPAIEAASGAERGFDPSDVNAWKGKTVILKGYYNRSGWDFDAHYDFATGIKGVPVAGTYEPNVRAAFDEGSRKTKFGIDDHVGWDVIAVVQGPGQINRRVTTEWRDANTHQIILKTEHHVPEPCVVVKIVGLRAGPVAVGAK